MNLYRAGLGDVPVLWPHVAHYIATSLANVGLSDVEDIHQSVLRGEAMLWVAAEGNEIFGAGVTALVKSCGERVCEIVAWGSDSHSNDLFETIASYAQSEKCSRVRLFGRKGWARKLPDWKLKALILEKVL